MCVVTHFTLSRLKWAEKYSLLSLFCNIVAFDWERKSLVLVLQLSNDNLVLDLGRSRVRRRTARWSSTPTTCLYRVTTFRNHRVNIVRVMLSTSNLHADFHYSSASYLVLRHFPGYHFLPTIVCMQTKCLITWQVDMPRRIERYSTNEESLSYFFQFQDKREMRGIPLVRARYKMWMYLSNPPFPGYFICLTLLSSMRMMIEC